LGSAKGIYEKLGLTVSPEEIVESEQVRLVMVPVGESRLELLEPTSENSAIAKFLAKRGEGLHHVSLRVPDLVAAVERLKNDGVRLVSDEIKIGAGGHKYVFVHPSSAGGVLLGLGEAGPLFQADRRKGSLHVYAHLLNTMLILGVDTSGMHGSVALAQCEGGKCLVVEVVPLTGGTFSAQLLPEIAALLRKHEYSKQDIDGFAVASGPGSFTGLRVGLAAIKGLAEVLRKPIAAVSLLEVLALESGIQGRLTTLLDAGRNEVYVGTYEVSNGVAVRIEEKLLSRVQC